MSEPPQKLPVPVLLDLSGAESFSAAIVNSLPGIFYVHDRGGQMLRWNKNLERVSGYSGADIAGMGPLQFVASADRARVLARIEEVYAHGESNVEASLLTKEGREIPYYLTGTAARFGDRLCLMGVGLDVSARHAAEAALRELNESLEEKVAARTQAMYAALVRAEAADQSKSAFFSTLSHELRTPLNSVVGFTGLLLQQSAGPLNVEQARQLGRVQTNAGHLLNLINHLLDLAKLEAGQLEVRAVPFELGKLLKDVVAVVRPSAESKGLVLELRVDPALGEMTSDPARLKQILLNLLNNAVKFTERGSVMLNAAPQSDGTGVKLEVMDTGLGIEREHLAAIFEPFYRFASGRAPAPRGTGLSLTISQRVAGLLGGTISVSSELRHGSIFTVLLPSVPP